MGKLFDMDSPFMRVLSRIGDLMIMNFLMIICCIPVITIGASVTAMHYVFLKIVRGEEGYLVRGFFKSFKENFRQATIIWLIMLFIIMIYIGDFLIFRYSGIAFPKAVIIAVIAVALIVLMAAVYVFPLLGRFENTVKNTIKNAMMIALANLPKTLLMILMYAAPFVIIYFSSYSIIFVFMFGISLPAFGAAWLYSGIFKKFEPEEEQVSDFDFTVKVDEEIEEIDRESE